MPYLLLLSLLLAPKIHAAFGFNIDGTLNKYDISHAYFEGDFYRILPPLETFRQSYPNPSENDQIFTYKYLSVIYAADSSTRKKAESCMVQLVKLMPTIELTDLYVSDDIQALFKNVQTNFLKEQKYVREHDLYGHPRGADSTLTTTSKSRKKSHPVLWWTLGGLGVTAAAATAYFVLSESTSPGNHNELGN
ncbi:MAG TPA: hypothetical protein VJ385_18570 [Fibrobacteria bacterium]|nr:hypothetical protein [Fibrobacteria bacterium]